MSAPLVGSPLCEHAYPSLRARDLRASPSDQGPGRLWVGSSAPLRTFSGVRLIIARCSIEYSGRLSTHLPEATRLLMIKSDGTLMVWSDLIMRRRVASGDRKSTRLNSSHPSISYA